MQTNGHTHIHTLVLKVSELRMARRGKRSGGAEGEGEVFRLSNKRLHLTYRGHIEAKQWLRWMETEKGKKIKEYSIVWEVGESGYPHTHVLVWFEKICCTTNSRFFDWEGVHPNIKPVVTGEHWGNIVAYHRKQGVPVTNVGPEVGEPDPGVIKKVWACASVSEALLTVCTSLGTVGGVIAAFDKKPVSYGEPPEVAWRPWQQELHEELTEGKVDDRKIIWYWDPKGGGGKTFFAKYMGMYRGAFVTEKANAYHVATQVQGMMQKGGVILCVIFNFTRQSESLKIYQALESLKDGMITAEKYRGETLMFTVPHVVVFANYLPMFWKVSLDRWDVRLLDREGLTVTGRWGGEGIRQWLDKWRRDVKPGGTLEEAGRALVALYEQVYGVS